MFTFTTPDTLGAFEFRVTNRDVNPWFLLADVCRVLDLDNPSKCAARLDEDERVRIGLSGALHTIQGAKINDLGVGTGNSEAWFVNEMGLYSLILTSRKPQAKAFKRWITHEVLPAIRKDGGYVLGEEKVRTGEMTEDQLILRAMQMLQAKTERLAAERDQLAAHNAVLAPKAAVVDTTFVGANTRLRDFLRTFDGVNLIASPRALVDLGDLWQDGHGRYRVNRASGADCFFREKWEMTPGYGHRLTALTVTKAGAERITRYYQQGKLPMKKELA